MTESPAELLTRAADRLEELAAAAPSGRWDVQEFPGVPGVILSVDYRSMLGYHVVEGGRAPRKGAPVMNRGAAMWTAALSPVVAVPLVAWLRDEVLDHEDDPQYWADEPPALVFAKQVLGEQ